MKATYPILLVLILAFSCQQKRAVEQVQPEEIAEVNPAAESFNLANSDSLAIAIADDVMLAMGGRQNWDKTRYLSWVFFGSRKHLWDKNTGDVRIESFRDSSIVLMNINDQTGRVLRDSVEVTQPDSLAKFLENGMGAWINDSYWLVMPFKLKDSGVTLKYVGEDTTKAGEACDVLSLTFENVGVTPQNKYLVSVDKETRFVNQWAYYPTVESDTARFVLPWADYKKHGNILLSDNRGNSAIAELAVMDSVDRMLFEEF